jgi:hypothetical protein
MAPGTVFIKKWIIRNDGTVAWPAGCRLAFFPKGGSQRMSGPLEATPLPFPVSIGQEVEVGVTLVAPSHPGRCVGLWRMSSPWGSYFGHFLCVRIEVIGRIPFSQSVPFVGQMVPQVHQSHIQMQPRALPSVQQHVAAHSVSISYQPQRPQHLDAAETSAPVDPYLRCSSLDLVALSETEAKPDPYLRDSSYIVSTVVADPYLRDSSDMVPVRDKVDVLYDVSSSLPRDEPEKQECDVDTAPVQVDLCDNNKPTVASVLRELKLLGFDDTTKNLRMMQRHGLRIDAIVAELRAQQQAAETSQHAA